MIMSFQNGRFTLNKTLPFDLHIMRSSIKSDIALLMRLRKTVAYLGHVL